tara:strand:- start:6725 stop:7636 length:912 start_codon:yes stop_codon:yes gene_type:complete
MSVSFEVKTTSQKVIKLVGRACFAAVNNVLSYREKSEGIQVESIKYLPFYNNKYSQEDNMHIEDYTMSPVMSWDLSEKWWKYLMSLPFITDMMENKPKTLKAFKAGFKVDTQFPADRVMIALFLLRAPQYQGGIVRNWEYLVDSLNIHKDTAFAMAFGLNNTGPVAIGTPPEALPELYNRVTTYSSSENTIVYPEHFSIRAAKMMINRLLCEDYDKTLYSGKQETFRRAGSYQRAYLSNKDALGRFFCKKPAGSLARGNFQLVALSKRAENTLGNRRALNYSRESELQLTSENLKDLAKLLES